MPSTYICVSFIVFSIPRITYVNVMTLWCSMTMHFHYYLTFIFIYQLLKLMIMLFYTLLLTFYQYQPNEQSSFAARCTRCNIMWLSLSETCNKSVMFPGYSVFSTNKTDRHDIMEILLKVALNTINKTTLNRLDCI
jgi:hypothetical protein